MRMGGGKLWASVTIEDGWYIIPGAHEQVASDGSLSSSPAPGGTLLAGCWREETKTIDPMEMMGSSKVINWRRAETWKWPTEALLPLQQECRKEGPVFRTSPIGEG
eukprot:TRINITY_DN66972_c2_g1_i4.p1 TRINITY_DN66972_c2_g1~~TRINITY_DN66972_c2_g1_i4.p1  ORF type:complete len:106 (-),score=7.84 TRINITY_DN66972_c2_g1_i4:116-433(-)